MIGQALCQECYNYADAVLFNAHAGVLWRRLSIYVRRELAKAVGLSRSTMDTVARVSFVKVAEYQARGVVHFHAVLRIDGPDGATSPPPDWATAILLDACLRGAVGLVRIEVAHPAAPVEQTKTLRFGSQVDTQVIHDDAQNGAEGVSMRSVAGYIAKYATKSAETAGSTPRRIKHPDDVAFLRLPAHTTRMIRTCFELAALPVFADLRLDRWAHMLGYRGHCTTKSRYYSMTFATLRGNRKTHRDTERRTRLGLPSIEGRQVIIDAKWTFLRTGLSYGERPLVEGIRRSQGRARSMRVQGDSDGTGSTAA